jgi:hypothetical protein
VKVPKTIAVDFDGTLCDFNYPDIGPPKPGAIEALTRFRAEGYQVVIWSCRTCSYYMDIFCPDGEAPADRKVYQDMKAWLDRHGVPYDWIDMGDKGKPMCDFYVDDKAVRFKDNWPEVEAFILWQRCE